MWSISWNVFVRYYVLSSFHWKRPENRKKKKAASTPNSSWTVDVCSAILKWCIIIFREAELDTSYLVYTAEEENSAREDVCHWTCVLRSHYACSNFLKISLRFMSAN